ncbi:hypothetical protein [Apibacter sp. wkB309]|uniref:hypothetical protein n=1 Tax=Apibacter sp. wkB309 TaxID=1679467 RepID=UPI0021012130|nr:hypothetical protein [Apibacter sp. wkB309]
MRINLFTPMREENQKILDALKVFSKLKHSYEVIITGIGREKIAKSMITKPKSDLDVLVGFTAITGIEKTMPKELQKGSLVEVVASSLYGYSGEIFENGKIILSSSHTHFPKLSSLTSDKFVTTSNIPIGTLINMEDYTFMYMKRPQDFILRIISDFLPHQEEIDFFKIIEEIIFSSVIEFLEGLN